MLPTTGRVVVLLCGPPGAGKTTAALTSGLDVYDRDDPQWPDERTFRQALERLGHDPTARAVVIRSGATSTARAKTATLIGATHQYLLTAEPTELAHRIATRARPDTRNGLASIATWFDRHDTDDAIPPFPGWHDAPPAPNVTPTPTAPTRRPPSRDKATARSGRPWRRTTARVIRRDAGICHLCGMPGADTADHLTPVTHGGALHALDNLAAAHLRCNKIRGARPIEVARAELMAETTTTSVDAWTW